MREFRSVTIIIVLAVISISCSTNSGGSNKQPPGPGPIRTPAPPPSLDSYFEQLNRNNPNIDGFSLDEQGNVRVYVKQNVSSLSVQDLETLEVNIQNSIESVFGNGFLSSLGDNSHNAQTLSHDIPEIKLLQSKYDIAKLAQWRQDMTNLFNIDGVVLIDLDEARNQIKVGIETEALRSKIEAELNKLGIPLEAVLIEKANPFSLSNHSLSSRVTPAVGGLGVNYSGSPIQNSPVCTLGFLASHSRGSTMVLPSHCSKRRGNGSDGTKYYQPTINNSYYLGDEVVDPNHFTGGKCPAGQKCRWSDATLVKLTSSASFDLGSIAQTIAWWNNSKQINHDNPTFKITSERTFPVSGEYLDKVGLTTGWTFGIVTETCVDVRVSQDITLLCQDVVSKPSWVNTTRPISSKGDSGAPVFRWLGNNVVLYGILWGSRNDNGEQFIFSAMTNIEHELGSLQTIQN